VKRKRSEPGLSSLLGVPRPALPPGVALERRDVAARHALLTRIYSEFAEMRCLAVTPVQAAKLFGLSPEVASRVLGQLTDSQILSRKKDGRFALRGETR